MAPKRKNDQVDAMPTGRDKKKQRMAEAREIAVQPMPTATPLPQTAGAGHSTSAISDSALSSPSFPFMPHIIITRYERLAKRYRRRKVCQGGFFPCH